MHCLALAPPAIKRREGGDQPWAGVLLNPHEGIVLCRGHSSPQRFSVPPRRGSMRKRPSFECSGVRGGLGAHADQKWVGFPTQQGSGRSPESSERSWPEQMRACLSMHGVVTLAWRLGAFWSALGIRIRMIITRITVTIHEAPLACPRARARAHAHAPVTSMHAAGAAGRALRGGCRPAGGRSRHIFITSVGAGAGRSPREGKFGRFSSCLGLAPLPALKGSTAPEPRSIPGASLCRETHWPRDQLLLHTR